MRIKNLASLSRFTCLLPIIFIGVSSTVFATQNGQVASQTPSSPASVAPSAAPAITSSSNKAIPQATPLTTGKTNWVDLSAEQKAALSPLAKEWDKMDDLRKKKWLGIANKYANMKPEEQHRVQERVQAWVNMTPEQRMAVRENFSNTAKKKHPNKNQRNGSNINN